MKDEFKTSMTHNLILEGRKNITVSGVEGVVSSNEREVLLNTVMGDMIILGEGMHIDNLCIESGDLRLSGRVDSIQYRMKKESGSGLMARLFG